MGKYFIKLADDKYIEWSTVVDAPVSEVMNRERAVLNSEDPRRIDRCDKQVTSRFDYRAKSPEEAIEDNHAGENREELTLEEILEQYAPAAFEEQDEPERGCVDIDANGVKETHRRIAALKEVIDKITKHLDEADRILATLERCPDRTEN